MRLTKERREQIIDSVLASTFIAAERRAVAASAVKALHEMPPKLPAFWLLAHIAPELRDALKIPPEECTAEGTSRPNMAAQYAAARKLREKEDMLRAELGDFLATCRTYKQVVEKMPELEPHLPQVTKPLRIVVSTAKLSAALYSAGFNHKKDKP
jgi:hypothetical protein